ncbi:hypothetical protein D3C71_2029810 [compost metagenome]
MGWPVLPEVYCRNARSSAWRLVARKVPGSADNSATLAISRRLGTCGLSRRASSLASLTVISMLASALPRMPAWRRRCSSICDRRMGG